MPIPVKVDGEWKQATSLHTKVNGDWKEIVTAYSKKEGVWVKVYESYAIIQFNNYPYKIPTMAGWQYSWDGEVWEDITYDGMELNTLGYGFTGYVKVKSELSLNAHDSKTKGLRFDGTPLSLAREYSTSTTMSDTKAIVCGGRVGMNTYYATVDAYDASGNRSSVENLSRARGLACSFGDNPGIGHSGAYICGGATYDGSQWIAYPTVDRYNNDGVRTSGASLSVSRYLSSAVYSYVGGYVFGGKTSSANSNVVDYYHISGLGVTTLTPMSSARYSTCAFGLDATTDTPQSVYVYGGVTPSGVKSKVGEKYTVDDNTMTTSTYLSVGRSNLTACSLGDSNASYGSYAILCGGETDNGITDIIEKVENTGVVTSVGNMSCARANATSFVTGEQLNERAYICGGTDGTNALDVVDIYDVRGVMTTGTALSTTREALTSFVLDDKGFVCGGISGSTHRATVDIYKDTNAIPVSAGSEYNLNGMSGVAENSGTIFIDDPVTGTVKYAKGTI
mgnify:CR=1 FL=1